MCLPLISIIIPVYNCEKCIERIAETIRNQSYKNIEILLVNDGSVDSTRELCEKEARLDYRIKFISKENGGVSSARNIGLKNATGKYVLFVDADDSINETYISDLLEHTGEADLVLSKIVALNEKCEILRDYGCNDNVDKKNGLKLKYWSVWGKLFKRTDLEGIWFDENIAIAEDLKFVVDYVCKIKPIVTYCENAVYYYMDNVESAMHSKYSEKFLNGLLAEVECYEKIKKYKKLDEENSQLIANGSYQFVTRFFEMSLDEQNTMKQDYVVFKCCVKRYIGTILKSCAESKKKVLVITAVVCPALVSLYKKWRKKGAI